MARTTTTATTTATATLAFILIACGPQPHRSPGPFEPEDAGHVVASGGASDSGRRTEDGAGARLEAGPSPADAWHGMDQRDQRLPDAGEPVLVPPARDPAPPAGAVPLFVVAGQGGRTVTSCDDGKTWLANDVVSNDNGDHSPWSHKGLAFGGGTFIGLFGWGYPSTLKVSDDGVTWRRQSLDGAMYSGVSYGTSSFMLMRGSRPLTSLDAGRTWTPAAPPALKDDIRSFAGGAPAPGRFVAFGDARVPAVSNDGGKTWRQGAGCGAVGNMHHRGGLAVDPSGVVVIVATDGSFCRSGDGGATWLDGNIGGRADGQLTWAGGAFWVASGGTAYTSEDGSRWTPRTLRPAGVTVHGVARSASGTYAGYDKNGSFFRSLNGHDWIRAGAVPGPSLFSIVAGYGKPSPRCPAP